MKIYPSSVPDVQIIEPQVFRDERGFFMETWNRDLFQKLGLDCDFVQDNHSRSAQGVLRGLHYQIGRPQGKLVRVVTGRVFDVAVDLRRSSPTFGRWVGYELSAENNLLLWIPPGFAHGFLTLEEGSDFVYKCTDFYSPNDDRAILWSDPAIGIEWPLSEVGTPLISSKDAAAPRMAEAELYG
jgi:dTDP-4-dehydrorhamnose 3,5-epimerase